MAKPTTAKKKLTVNLEALQTPGVVPPRRFVRNAELMRCLGISKMTLWRFKNDPVLGFPKATAINGIEFNDLDEIYAWIKARQ
jgi:predicted DNA-binding transcriptional regulator AlpA